MIEKLQTADPFYRTEYIEDEKDFFAEGRCLLLNLERLGGQPVLVEEQPLYPLGSAVVEDAECCIPGRALLVRGFEDWDLSDAEVAEKIRNAWDPSGQMGAFCRSSRTDLGNGVAFKFVMAEPDSPSGIHREHAAEIDELHLLVAGSGAVQLFRENDPATLFQEFPLAPGMVHPPTWNAEGVYPWHRYMSISRSVFAAVEISR